MAGIGIGTEEPIASAYNNSPRRHGFIFPLVFSDL